MHFDIAIIGGAVMGSSAAFWLSRMAVQGLSVAVIEADPTYAQASTALSVASIRQQFSNPINVRISQFGVAFLRNFQDYTGSCVERDDLHLVENGYLFLAGKHRAPTQMRRAQAMQAGQGAQTKLLSPQDVATRFPYLNADDLALASYGEHHEGWFDNMGLLSVFRTAAQAQGVHYITGRVAGLKVSGRRVTGVDLADGRTISAGTVINAAGTRAASIMRMVGQDIPVEPRKRTVFMIDAPNARHPDAPLIIDYSGIYLRPEGQHWLTAVVPEGDCAVAPDDFEPDHHLFEDVIWEKLFHRCAGFDAVKVLRVWAGHYAYNTLDQNAIIGLWPALDNLYLMNGFSGHGLQQAPAVGRGIAELILSGAYQTLDLTPLGPERILRNEPFLEMAIV